MPDRKISADPRKSTLADLDLFPIVDSEVTDDLLKNKHVRFRDILAGVNLDGKQDTLTPLTNGQAWVGNGAGMPTPTDVATQAELAAHTSGLHITQGERDKLAGLPRTAAQTRDLLAGLTGNDRLDASAIKGISTGSGGVTEIPAHLQSEKQALFSRAGSLFWEVVNQVPDTPGEQSAVGHFLRVDGTDDQDYRWQALGAADILSLAKESRGSGDRGMFLAVSSSDEDALTLVAAPTGGGGGGTDQTARNAAATAQARADANKALIDTNISNIQTLGTQNNNLQTEVTTADGKAVAAQTAAGAARTVADRAEGKADAAQLDADIVFEAGPPFIAGVETARNLNISVRHPLGAFPAAADILAINIQGATPILAPYDRAYAQQVIKAAIPATAMRNIFGASAPNRKLAGDYISVNLRIQQGNATTNGSFDPAKLFYDHIIEVPVISPSEYLTQSEVDARANARISAVVNDDFLLDLAQASRTSGDRGKYLGIASGNENALTLLDAPSGSGGLNQTQVDDRVRAIATEDYILDFAQSSRATADRGKLLALASDNENNLVLIDAPSGGGLTQSQVNARITAVVIDDFIIDLAQSSRTSADRGKFLGVASGNENQLALFSPPESGLNQAAVDARIVALVNDDRILDLAQPSRGNSDRGKLLATSGTNENNLVLIDAPSGGSVTDDSILDLAKTTRVTADRKKLLGLSATNQDALTLRYGAEAPAWADIPANDPIVMGQIVTHGGSLFGAITNHNKGASGPDGDTTNWIILSNWTGTWSNKWYPAGAFVSRQDGGSGMNRPYVALQNVVQGDVAPDNASNTKWLLLGASEEVILHEIQASRATADRGKFVAVSATDEDALVLVDAPTGEAAPDGRIISRAITGSGGNYTLADNEDEFQVIATTTGSKAGSYAVIITLAELTTTAKTFWFDTHNTGASPSGGNQIGIVARRTSAQGRIVNVALPTASGLTPPAGTTISAVYGRSAKGVKGDKGDKGDQGTTNLTDDAVLDLAQASRSASDRGKFLGTSAGNENALALLDAPSGGGLNIELQDLTPHYLVKTALESTHVLSLYIHSSSTITSATTLVVEIGGVRVHSEAWTARAGEHVVEFAISSTEAAAIRARHNPLPNFFTGSSSVANNRAQVRWLNASNVQQHVLPFTIALLDAPVKSIRRVLAPWSFSRTVRSSGNAASGDITLPSNFSDWNSLEVIVGTTSDAVKEVYTFPTSAIQSSDQTKIGYQIATSFDLRTVSSQKVVRPLGNSSRIIYASLI